MENENEEKNKLYDYISELMFEQQITKFEIQKKIISEGWEKEDFIPIMEEISNKEKENEKPNARNDIFWGAIICIGGIVATILDFGYIFYGAIIFGTLMISKGITNHWDK